MNSGSVRILQLWTILLCCSPLMTGHSWTARGQGTPGRNPASAAAPSPFFDDISIRSVEATQGQTLLLPCTVRYLGDKVVSWIRSRDLHILTSGPVTFSGDNRYESVPSTTGDFWGLRIRGVQVEDSGQYECQVNTDPKMSLAINLTVSGGPTPQATNSHWIGRALIRGPRELHLREGSRVTVTCEISPLSSPQNGQYGVFVAARPRVRWLHDDQEILFESTKVGRISVDNYFGESNWKVTSILKIEGVTWRDSGQYTCLQMSGKPDRVKLVVVEGEHSEAMQRDFPIPSGGTRTKKYVTAPLKSGCLAIYLFIYNFCK